MNPGPRIGMASVLDGRGIPSVAALPPYWRATTSRGGAGVGRVPRQGGPRSVDGRVAPAVEPSPLQTSPVAFAGEGLHEGRHQALFEGRARLRVCGMGVRAIASGSAHGGASKYRYLLCLCSKRSSHCRPHPSRMPPPTLRSLDVAARDGP